LPRPAFEEGVAEGAEFVLRVEVAEIDAKLLELGFHFADLVVETYVVVDGAAFILEFAEGGEVFFEGGLFGVELPVFVGLVHLGDGGGAQLANDLNGFVEGIEGIGFDADGQVQFAAALFAEAFFVLDGSFEGVGQFADEGVVVVEMRGAGTYRGGLFVFLRGEGVLDLYGGHLLLVLGCVILSEIGEAAEIVVTDGIGFVWVFGAEKAV